MSLTPDFQSGTFFAVTPDCRRSKQVRRYRRGLSAPFGGSGNVTRDVSNVAQTRSCETNCDAVSISAHDCPPPPPGRRVGVG